MPTEVLGQWTSEGDWVRPQPFDQHIKINSGYSLTLNPQDYFGYDNKLPGQYSLGWYADSWNPFGSTAWLAGYGGLKLFTNGTPRLSITNIGRVGIGTTSPAALLDVRGGAVFSAENAAWGFDEISGQPNLRLGIIKKGGFAPMFATASGQPMIFAQTNQSSVTTDVANATLTERMRIDGNGNVGIGIPAPQAKLDVLAGSNKTLLGLDDKSAISFIPTTPSVWFHIHHTNNSQLQFSNGGTVGAVPMLTLDGSNATFNMPVSTPSVRWASGSQLVNDQGGSLELGASNGVAGVGAPYIDFHYNGLAQDYNVRLMNDANGRLSVFGNLNITGGGQLLINGAPFSGSQWLNSGSNIYYNGKVGIGIAPDPFSLYALTVNGTLNATTVNTATLSMGDKIFWQTSTTGEHFYYNGTGSVSIGTTVAGAGYKFQVNGFR